MLTLRSALANSYAKKDVALRLDDLKRERQIRGAGDARHVALDLGILGKSVGKVLLLLLGGPRLVRNGVAFDDASAAGHGPYGAHLIKRRRLRRVVLKIPVRGADRLPDAAEVWFSARGARNLRLCRYGPDEHACCKGPADDSRASIHYPP
jgi:hypothetical protein